jgi:spermidine/putrescine transport system permease protein
MKYRSFPAVVTVATLVFLYLPVLMLVVNSFNESRFSTTWGGFSLQWYEKLWEREDIWNALLNSLLIAAVASLASMVLGTAAALGLNRLRAPWSSGTQFLLGLPLVLPELLMGMSLLTLFVTLRYSLGMGTIIIAHVTFCLSYVAYVVSARLADFDWSFLDAARDLGAHPAKAYRDIVFPLLLPGILAGGLLAFTVSIDDFVVTFFVGGPGTSTLPVLVYGMVKKSRELPVINALSTLLLTFTFISTWVAQRLTRRD